MAKSRISGAAGTGKTIYDRAAILRAAHAAARARMAPSSTYRQGDYWNAEAGGYVPTCRYREAFRFALTWAWRDAKVIADDQAWEAAQPKIPQEVADCIREMRADAWWEPINARGNERYSAILAEARDLEDEARAKHPVGASAVPLTGADDEVEEPRVPANVDIVADGEGYQVLADGVPWIPRAGESLALMGKDDLVTLACGAGPTSVVHFIFPADLDLQ